MSRIRTLFTVVVPSLLAGGLIFGSAFGHASVGRDELIGYWPAASDVTATGAAKQVPPPAPPAPPKGPPAPPKPPKHGAGSGVSVSIDNGTIKIDGVKGMVAGQLDAVRDSLRNNPAIPKDVRDKVLERLDKVRTSVDKRLSHLDVSDPDKLGEEMDKMGEEIDKAMEGFDKDMEKWGDKFGKDLAKDLTKNLGHLGNLNIHIGDDDDDDDDTAGVPMAPDVDIDADDSDLRDAIQDLKDVALKPAQRDAIGKLRADSDRTVAAARKQLDDLSDKLHTALGNPATTDVQIATYVDQISAQEAAIRKARLLAWANARRVLDDAQRKKIEDAAKKKTK